MKDVARRYWTLREEAAGDLGARSSVKFDDLPKKLRLVTRVALEKLRDELRVEFLEELLGAAEDEEAAETRIADFAERYRSSH